MDCLAQQQHIQLAPTPSRGGGTPTPAPMQPEHQGMCPFLHGMVCNGEVDVIMAQLTTQDDATAESRATEGEMIVKLEGEFQVFEKGMFRHIHCSIDEVTVGRNTIVHVAAAAGHHVLIQELYVRFRNRGLLSRRNSALDTALHCAARAGHATAVKVIAELARDCAESILGCKNEAGDTALHLAARQGHGAAVEALVLEAAELAAELNNSGVSPLYLAVISGSVEAVRAIASCRDASSAGPNMENALHAAVFQSSEMVELLLEWRPVLVDEVDCNGSTALHFASSDGDPIMVRAILSAATPPRTMYRKDSGGLSALHVAARMGHAGIVMDMLQTCPDAMELRDNDGRNFVHTAAWEKRSKVVALCNILNFPRRENTQNG